jgi:hypothetical protein
MEIPDNARWMEGGNLYEVDWENLGRSSTSTSTALTNDQKTTVTGTDDAQFAAQIIGKDIPVFVGGQALMGCKIAEGPFIRTVDDVGLVDMIVTPCSVATPTATRQLTSIRLNGTETFTSGDGGTTWVAVEDSSPPNYFAGVVIEVRYGTEEQLPFDSSIERYGERAVPYRSHILIELKNIPLSVFNNEIPFVSVYVYESASLTRQNAILKLADYARFNTDELEVSVSGVDTFWIVIKQSSFIGYLQELQKTVGRNWNINPSDKLRISESFTTSTTTTLALSDIIEDSLRYLQADPRSIPSSRYLGFIDINRDNDFNTVKASRYRYPVSLTDAENSETYEIPIGTSALLAKQIVNDSLLIDDIARDKVTFKVLPTRRGLQPGDVIDFSFRSGYKARITSVARNAADWTLDIVAERLDLTVLFTPPTITSNGGGATAAITVNEESGVSVTTVTADDADATGAFSISGGADAALFTIDADTGVLEFLDAPDYEDPQDADGNNTYVVIVQATGDGATDTQTITVTVADVVEGSGVPMGLLLALTYS